MVTPNPNLSVSTKVLTTALARIKNKIVWAGNASRDMESEFGAAKQGQTVYARRPVRYNVFDGVDQTGNFQTAEDGLVPVVVDEHKSIPVDFPLHDRVFKMPNYTETYIDPMSDRLVTAVDQSVAAKGYQISNFLGTPGTPMSDTSDVGDIRTFMDRRGIPMENRCGMLEPGTAEALAKNIENKHNVSGSNAAMRQASICRIRNMDLYSTPVQFVHTVGNYDGSGAVNGGSQTKNYSDADDVDSTKKVSETMRQQLVTDGWSNNRTGLLKKGDVITIGNVFDVNQDNKATIAGELKTFTVLEDVNSNGSGEATLVISPAIIPTGAYQNCSAGPADNAAITVVTGDANSQHVNELFWPKSALQFVMVPIIIDDDLQNLRPTRVSQEGLSLSMFVDGDINDLRAKKRVDALFGTKWTREHFAVRRTR